MTGVSRRSLLGVGAAGIAAGTIGIPVPGALAAGPSYTVNAALYTRSRYTPLTRKGFSLVRAGTGTPVVLKEIADIDGARPGAEGAFRLTFSARGAPPAQGTYSLRRSGFAATSIFVAPDPERGGVTAIINSAR